MSSTNSTALCVPGCSFPLVAAPPDCKGVTPGGATHGVAVHALVCWSAIVGMRCCRVDGCFIHCIKSCVCGWEQSSEARVECMCLQFHCEHP
jgi:hypothetical protein